MFRRFRPIAATGLAATAICASLAVSPLAPSAQAVSSGAPRRTHCPQLDTSLSWYGMNRARLQHTIDKQGSCSGKSGELAVFDWDNTVVKNDVGDATFFFLLRHGLVQRPSNWKQLSAFFTPQAESALTTACGKPGRGLLPTATNTQCADELLSIYTEGETRSGTDAFGAYNHRRVEPAYAMVAQALAGYSAKEAEVLAGIARAQNLANPQGSTQRVGTKDVTAWVRYYPQITNLIATMKAARLRVVIVSASPEPVVRAWGKAVGIRGENVVGVRTTERRGRLTGTLAGCGGDATAIPYIEGKRCAINSYVLDNGRGYRQAPAADRQVFAAGDSDTDVTFVADATQARLVINRNKTELMCNAYFNADGKWLINPMFIEPKGKQSATYPCSTSGSIAPDGSKRPLVIGTKVVPDQVDQVYVARPTGT